MEAVVSFADAVPDRAAVRMIAAENGAAHLDRNIRLLALGETDVRRVGAAIKPTRGRSALDV